MARTPRLPPPTAPTPAAPAQRTPTPTPGAPLPPPPRPPTPSQPPPGIPISCEEDSVYAQLDFWLGEWVVHDAQGNLIGRNRIEKVLKSCALLEHWQDAAENEGKSLFYVDRATRRWRQVWVTDAGLTKEKEQASDFEGPGVRFQGQVRRHDGLVVLDRTTLTKLPDGTVRQTIEQSADSGRTWFTWEGLYSRP